MGSIGQREQAYVPSKLKPCAHVPNTLAMMKKRLVGPFELPRLGSPRACTDVIEDHATVVTDVAPMATDEVRSTDAPNSRPATVMIAPPETAVLGAKDADRIGAAK